MKKSPQSALPTQSRGEGEKSRGQRSFRAAIAVVASLVLPVQGKAAVVLEERRGDVTAKAEIDRDRVALSGRIVLTLTVEGPSRVEVAPPGKLLTPESKRAWSVKEQGLPTVEILEGGRQRWKQEFELSPFVAGPKVEVALAPLKIKAGSIKEMEIRWSETASIQVTTSIGHASPDALRPITDIEPAPPPSPARSADRTWLFLLGAAIGTVLLAIAGRVAWLRRKRRAVGPSFGAEWALRELKSLETASPDFGRLAEVLRLYLQSRLDIPAPRMTTSEIVAALGGGDLLPAAVVAEARSVLERCDVAKFTKGAVADDERNESGAYVELTKHVVETLGNYRSAPQ
jgi:hypothetical protein